MNCRRAKPICPHASSLAGVWGKPSPQVPPEARPNGGPAARVQGTSQPRAEGARKDSGDFSQALLLETPQLTFAEPSDMRVGRVKSMFDWLTAHGSMQPRTLITTFQKIQVFYDPHNRFMKVIRGAC